MSFNAKDWASEGSSIELSEGWTDAVIDEVIQKTSGAGNQYVSVRFSLPQFNGKKLWENLNVSHPREEVREIAYRILANIMSAVGINSIRDEKNPAELQMRELRVLVSKDKDGDWCVKRFEPSGLPGVPLDSAPTPAAKAPMDIPEDDIPF
tara:strand:- start:4346 stop:4798 length:453 start_codon:yes stop_codon:yes gene_type:complete